MSPISAATTPPPATNPPTIGASVCSIPMRMPSSWIGFAPRIEDWYPGWELPGRELKEKALLVSALLYEASNHANTSGLFKAYHKGFGGFGRDALTRILAPMRLELPVLLDGAADHGPPIVARRNAEEFVEGARAISAISIRPTIPISTEATTTCSTRLLCGTSPLSSRAFDRMAGCWRRPRFERIGSQRARSSVTPKPPRALSSACSTAIDSRFIALSYNTEGIVPIDRLASIMSRHGRLEILGADYVQYRGGKQSMFRRTHNLELLMVVTRGERARPGDREAVTRYLLERRIQTLLKGAFVPKRVLAAFESDGGAILFTAVALPMRHFHLFADAASAARAVLALDAGPENLALFAERLSLCLCSSRREEAEVLLGILRGGPSDADRASLQMRLSNVIKKFAHKRYRGAFEAVCAEAEALAASAPEAYARLSRDLAGIKRVAALRFAG